MPEHVTLVFEISWGFQESQLLKQMEIALERKPTNAYEKKVWSIDGLTIKLYEKKLVVQGGLNYHTKEFLRGLRNISGLALDGKNAAIWLQVFPSRHNAVLCPECKETSLTIGGEIEGLDMVFKGECGHKNNLRPPMFMLTNRILPDVNILISKSLSRLVGLGYFDRFEVVVPEFILDLIDEFKGPSRKDAVSDELVSLRALEKEGKININNLTGLPLTIDSSLQEEDKVILELAQLTNSVLLTSDRLLKERAVLQERPTIYISPDDYGKIKVIEKVRTP